eukprot:2336775-Prymnesium_polylepis.1
MLQTCIFVCSLVSRVCLALLSFVRASVGTCLEQQRARLRSLPRLKVGGPVAQEWPGGEGCETKKKNKGGAWGAGSKFDPLQTVSGIKKR